MLASRRAYKGHKGVEKSDSGTTNKALRRGWFPAENWPCLLNNYSHTKRNCAKVKQSKDGQQPDLNSEHG